MDLAVEIAANADVVECFQETGRMAELVDAFARASKAMLAVSEAPGTKRKKRAKERETAQKLAMWEVKE